MLNFIKQCRFWKLPETLPPRTGANVEDGEWLTLSGRQSENYHCIHRFIWRETGLNQLGSYLERISTLFPPLPHQPETEFNGELQEFSGPVLAPDDPSLEPRIRKGRPNDQAKATANPDDYEQKKK